VSPPRVLVWLGGPCIQTGQLCALFEVRLPDGTGVQRRLATHGPNVRDLRHDEREKVEAEFRREGEAAAAYWLGLYECGVRSELGL
jgi:hypothetical protein